MAQVPSLGTDKQILLVVEAAKQVCSPYCAFVAFALSTEYSAAVSLTQVAGAATMGPEWSPGPENRSPGMPRPFSRLWDRSRGPKPPKYSPNSRSTAPGGR